MHVYVVTWQQTEDAACCRLRWQLIMAKSPPLPVAILSLGHPWRLTLPCELQVVLKMGQIVVEDVNIKVGLEYPRDTSLLLTTPWAGLKPGGTTWTFLSPLRIRQSVMCHPAASSLQCAVNVGWS